VVPANRIQVTVGSFVNGSSLPGLDSLGRAARLDLIWSLARIGNVSVMDSAVQARRHSVGVGRPTGGPRSPARAVGPDFSIGGTYDQVRGGIELRATLTDLRSGAVVLATSVNLSDRESRSRALDRLRDQLVKGMSGGTP
jgi:TolB-like protein